MHLLRHSILLLLILVLCGPTAVAQSTRIGTELDASTSFSINRNWQAEFGQKLRLSTPGFRVSKSETSAGLSFNALRNALKPYGWKLKFAGNYSFIWRYNSDQYYEPQHRVNMSALLSYAYGDWRFSFRERVKTTFRNTNRVSVRYNPKVQLSSRLRAAYARPDIPWEFFGDAEGYIRVNDPRGLLFDEYRLRIGATRQIDRNNAISAAIRLSREIQVSEPETFICLCLGYEFN